MSHGKCLVCFGSKFCILDRLQENMVGQITIKDYINNKTYGWLAYFGTGNAY